MVHLRVLEPRLWVLVSLRATTASDRAYQADSFGGPPFRLLALTVHKREVRPPVVVSALTASQVFFESSRELGALSAGSQALSLSDGGVCAGG